MFFFTTDPDEAKKKIEEIETNAMSRLNPSRVDTPEEGWQMVQNIKRKIREEAENKRWF
ncbi:hypothetical protein [Thermoactinomyces sp. CICC 23799]|jgi:hypothetical protein|uniref:hypothetical protein n=1 Tax=Thermoactinomyces sp. CICC 23799 TaxID=2767429 RepID=UPI0018DBB678|nr:hypothetical protein [Thermoactinomyces sp. CICC 23799]MBH8601377.1 hypothetical protein [Thermoactinomyces sp. CICC 23799]